MRVFTVDGMNRGSLSVIMLQPMIEAIHLPYWLLNKTHTKCSLGTKNTVWDGYTVSSDYPTFDSYTYTSYKLFKGITE